jgi:hypothetical protein
MADHPNQANKHAKPKKSVPAVSGVFADGVILETVYQPNQQQTAFVLWQHDGWTLEKRFCPEPDRYLVPYSATNNLIQHHVVLLPSEPEEYGSEEALIHEIQAFIHRYVDVSPLFEKIASYYVLLSWVYDAFNELPYLRLRGDPGSGKTRFLLTVGSLCYKPIFASGASTVSPLFRILDAFRGTLIIDEGDFRQSDERAEIVKILNNGNARGFPVLRTEVSSKGEFNPTAYAVFGPKLIATRGFFEDRALESRCLTEEMGQHRLRDDIPINLLVNYKEEALHLRNKLLLFRFRKLHAHTPGEHLVDRTIEPRLNQVFVPLLSIIPDPGAQRDIRELARHYHQELMTERSMDMEAQILEIIRDMLASPHQPRLTVKEITSWFIDLHGDGYERKITTKWIGSLIRKRLNLQTQKSHGVFIIPLSEKPKLDRLYEKYGVGAKEADAGDTTEEESLPVVSQRVDLGDLGDIERGYASEGTAEKPYQ